MSDTKTLAEMKEKFYLDITFGTPNTWLVMQEVSPKFYERYPALVSWINWKQLWSIQVSRKYRGQGIGHELMERANKIADTFGFSLVLQVNPFNSCPLTKDQLCGFYGEHGFVSLVEDKYIMTRVVLGKS